MPRERYGKLSLTFLWTSLTTLFSLMTARQTAPSGSPALGIHTIVHPHNRGYGGNQKPCYAAALNRGAEIVVMLHPDYQYEPKLIPALVACINSDLYDVALGSRILDGRALAGGMPLYKYVANRFLTLVENLILNQKLSEYHTGYRAFCLLFAVK